MSRKARWAAVEAAYALGVARLDAITPSQHLTATIAGLLGWETFEAVSLGDRLLANGAMDTFEKLKTALLPFVEAAEEAEQVSTKPAAVFTDEQAEKIVHALKETLKDGLFGIRYDIDKSLRGACNDIGLFLNGPGHAGSVALQHLVTLHAKTMKGDRG